MGKVRVPVELRPPERFDAFKDPDTLHSYGTFRVIGVFRNPKHGEYYWRPNSDAIIAPITKEGGVVMLATADKNSPRVILEKVSP